MSVVSESRVVRVLPDVPAIDKEFDYLVPDGMPVELGDVVRVDLHGRRVGGWVVALDVEPDPSVTLRALAKVSGRGPGADLLELAGWAAWRWAGRRAQLLRTASPTAVVQSFGRASIERADPGGPHPPTDPVLDRALSSDRAVLRLPPGADRYGLVRAAHLATDAGRQLLVLCPSVGEARDLASRLRRDRVRAVGLLGDVGGVAGGQAWARAHHEDVVVGARAGAWAPCPRLGRVLVLDEHDEGYQQEQAPTWHARDVVAERARRAAAACLLVSPCPTLEALDWGTLVTVPRGGERRGWPAITVVDQRRLDPALGPLFSPALVDLVRGEGRVLCVLNRTGRARMLACAVCATLARCEQCDAAVGQPEPGLLLCDRCGTERPTICLACGSTTLKSLRLGVSRAREELEALVGEPVGEVSGPGVDAGSAPDTRVVIGTEAVLHRIRGADAVAFLDFDQELLATRYRSAEQALGMLARAARVVRRRDGMGRLLVQTRTPDHPVIRSALQADPGHLVTSEVPLRQVLGLPPTTAMAVVSHAAAPDFIEALGQPLGVEVQGPVDGAWRLRAPDHETLCDALAAVPRPPGRLRVEVDPLRIWPGRSLVGHAVSAGFDPRKAHP